MIWVGVIVLAIAIVGALVTFAAWCSQLVGDR